MGQAEQYAQPAVLNYIPFQKDVHKNLDFISGGE
jgi:hypothetical protein